MSSTQLVGILNVTPDSFSDGGAYLNADAAVAQARRLREQGADIIDVGAESTRPGATPLSAQEEWARLEPVLNALPEGTYSLDTRHADNARKALEKVQWVNDVSGLQDAAMIGAVRDSGCRLVLMHSLSVPADKNIVLPEDADVVRVVAEWAVRRIAELEAQGIARSRLVLDPGLGFGKTAKQSLDIVQRITELKSMGLPLLVGHSRKSFLALACPGLGRDAATLEVSRRLISDGVAYIRVHDIEAHKALKEAA